jgi:MHS family proline/betaine transporter-like MFS transporter
MRLRLDESAAYENAHAEGSDEHDRNQLRRTVVNQWKPMLICAALVLTSTAADYMLTGYLPTYLKVVVHVGHTAGLVMITVTLTILMVFLVLVAMLSDRIGVKPIMWAGCGLLIAASIPAFLLIRSGGGYPVIFIGVLLIGLMELCFDSTSPSALPALFPTEVRYGALAIAYNISISAVERHHPTDRSSLSVRHWQRHGAGVHADLRGVGGRGHSLVHTGGGGQAAPRIGAVGRERAGGL